MKTIEGKNKGYTIVKIKSRWDTSHECQACGKDFSGKNSALVDLDNGNTAIICALCAEKI